MIEWKAKYSVWIICVTVFAVGLMVAANLGSHIRIDMNEDARKAIEALNSSLVEISEKADFTREENKLLSRKIDCYELAYAKSEEGDWLVSHSNGVLTLKRLVPVMAVEYCENLTKSKEVGEIA